MPAYTTIKWEIVEPHIGLITITRPERMNALNRTFFEEISELLDAIDQNDDILCYMITGGPRADGKPCFSAGADMKSRTEVGPTPAWMGLGTTNRIDEMLKPSIAVVDGTCTTGGMELMMACDFRIAAETAQFSDWHLKRTGVGLGSWGASTRLPRLVGLQKAKEMLLTGMLIDGKEAHRIGLVNRVFPSNKLMEGALEMARSIAAMRPEGVRLTLAFLETGQDMPKHQAFRWAQLSPHYMRIYSQMEQASAAFVEQKKKEKS